ncbi:malate synthase-like [Mytilus edulis]|uniref:malate synthase-like n=1 Tax=Mytilus edulis TaxID=6550 RepID=UPI0039EE633E
MDRLKIIKNHLLVKGREPCITTKICSFDSSQDCLHLKSGLQKLGLTNIEVSSPPVNYEHYYRTLLTPEAVKFVADLVNTFDNDVEGIFQERQRRKLLLDSTGGLPDFSKKSAILHGNWKVRPVPQRLQCRHVDLGDVSPSNTSHFVASLKTTAQGIQTDFDDGHCPTWKNQLLGLYNIYQFVHGNIAGVPPVDQAPVLMLRPRAWNMIEHNLLVNGKEVPGPLFDFGLLMYHNSRILLDNESGPFFYLSKIEGSNEARLWNKIFDYTERKLDLPHGCIKACVLIENILASFEMEEILYELKDHSAGLNCGIWDYSASFINKFGHRKEFVLPDRNKYVSMDRHFLKSYMDLVVKICHSHGAHATGGMAAPILPNGTTSGTVFKQIVDKVKGGKVKEIQAGVDGFMVYDLRLLQPMQQLFKKMSPTTNQHQIKRPDVNLTAKDLLKMPTGGVTQQGLRHNITVGILFIEAWLRGQGHYYLKGAVEDSATAEISRSQVWQWIRHKAALEDTGAVVTMEMVHNIVQEVIGERFWSAQNSEQFSTNHDKDRLLTAARMFEEIVTKRNFPEFITTYLNMDHTFLEYQKK